MFESCRERLSDCHRAHRATALVVLLLAVAGAIGDAGPGLPGFKLPNGFFIAEFAGSGLVHDLQAMTVDARGRVFVADRGHIHLLQDANRDGVADAVALTAAFPKDGAMGLLVEGDQLYFTGDGMVGRIQLDARGVAMGQIERLLPIKTGGEHAAHALRRGRDGSLYLICGNDVQLRELERLPNFDRTRSPVTDAVAGGVVRIAAKTGQVAIVCDGFRNAYDFDFGVDGALYTFDSDNERCVSLPWYEGMRFYRIVAGGHYGWQNPQRGTTWRMPFYWFDVVAPLADLGRGSPTGVTCYAGNLFPSHYQGGFFLSDWTFGVIYFATVQGNQARVERFLEATGENGFAPCASCVHPVTGELMVAIGGRGTRGGVYRIGYRGKKQSPNSRQPIALEADDRVQIRRAIQSRSANEMLADGVALLKSDFEPRRWLNAVRLLQLGLGQLHGSKAANGTVFEGYRGDGKLQLPASSIDALMQRFPTGDFALDREIARLFAIAGSAPQEFATRLAAQWSDESSPIDDIHGLICFAATSKKTKPSAALFRQAAHALLLLDRKLDARKSRRDRNWPTRIAEIHKALCQADSDFNGRMLADSEFGRFDHALFANHPAFDRVRAAQAFVTRLQVDPTQPPTADVLAIIGALPESIAVPIARKYWDEIGLRTRIIMILTRSPDPVDRDRFLEGCQLQDVNAARRSASALELLGAPNSGDAALALERALQQAVASPNSGDLPAQLGRLLHRATGLLAANATADEWSQAIAARFPNLPARPGNPSEWRNRLAKVDWPAGNAIRGSAFFRKLACGHCHNGNRAVGPDLSGVAGRFSRDDLFASIFDPNRTVPARYRTTSFVMKTGKVYEGVTIYSAADSTLIQVGMEQTVRLAADEIESRRQTERSLMPAGLLDRSTPAEIADLYAYLKTLSK